MNTGLLVITCGEEIPDGLSTTADGYIVLLYGMSVIEQLVIPVSVAVIYPLLLAVSHILDHPRTVRMLCLVIYAGKEFEHIVLSVVGVILVGSLSPPE